MWFSQLQVIFNKFKSHLSFCLLFSFFLPTTEMDTYPAEEHLKGFAIDLVSVEMDSGVLGDFFVPLLV